MVSFECDYIAGAHPEILKRLEETNMESLPGYGMDHYTESAKEKIKAACGCPEAEVEFLVGGTQTNAVVISTMLRDWEGVIAADSGHVSVHESGAIEFTGHKVLQIPAEDGKLKADAVRALLKNFYGDVTQIRVGVSDLGAYVDNVSRALLYFNEEYPELDVSFNVEPFPNMHDKILHNQLDLIITYGAELLRAPELNKIPVSNTQYDVGIIISKKHPLSRKDALGIEDIQDEQIAVLGQELSNDHEDRIRKWFEDNDAQQAPHMRVFNSFRNLQIALATGKCVAVMFRRVMDGMEDRLKFYPIKDADYTGADIVVAWKKEKYETKARYISQLLERQTREL